MDQASTAKKQMLESIHNYFFGGRLQHPNIYIYIYTLQAHMVGLTLFQP